MFLGKLPRGQVLSLVSRLAFALLEMLFFCLFKQGRLGIVFSCWAFGSRIRARGHGGLQVRPWEAESEEPLPWLPKRKSFIMLTIFLMGISL